MSDIKERLRLSATGMCGQGELDWASMCHAAADHIATLEQERNQYRMAAEEEAKFADEYKSESAANLQRALVAEKDAARYRYLRDEGDGFTIDMREQDIDGENWVTGYAAQELDEAIDAARAPDTSTQEVG